MPLTIAEGLPAEWAESTIVRHFADPYSNKALAESRQDWIDLDPVALDQESEAEDERYHFEELDRGVDVAELDYPEAHNLFFESMRRLLRPEELQSATVTFIQMQSVLRRGDTRTQDANHIDGSFSDPRSANPRLRLTGIACNILPTVVVQGGYKRSDFHYLGDDYFYLPSERHRHSEETIPIGRLVLLGPAAVHRAQPATEDVTRRFLRWSLYI